MDGYAQVRGKENRQVGIETDMATGTGWPFGGPWVPISEAACKAVFLDTIVNVKQKLMEIEFNVPKKERDFAKLKLIKAFPVEGENIRNESSPSMRAVPDRR